MRDRSMLPDYPALYKMLSASASPDQLVVLVIGDLAYGDPWSDIYRPGGGPAILRYRSWEDVPTALILRVDAVLQDAPPADGTPQADMLARFDELPLFDSPVDLAEHFYRKGAVVRGALFQSGAQHVSFVMSAFCPSAPDVEELAAFLAGAVVVFSKEGTIEADS